MKRSPATALWLSMLPGAGHIYVGQARKGILLIILFACAIQLADHTAFFGVMIPFIWLFGVIDAYRSAQEHNLLVETGRSLPKPAAFAFTRWWGWGLIGLGVVFFVDNFGWLNIEWIWNFWPLGLIGFGVYILRQPDVPQSDITAESPPPIPATPEPETSDKPESGGDTSEESGQAPDMPTESAVSTEPSGNADLSESESEPERD